LTPEAAVVAFGLMSMVAKGMQTGRGPAGPGGLRWRLARLEDEHAALREEQQWLEAERERLRGENERLRAERERLQEPNQRLPRDPAAGPGPAGSSRRRCSRHRGSCARPVSHCRAPTGRLPTSLRSPGWASPVVRAGNRRRHASSWVVLAGRAPTCPRRTPRRPATSTTVSRVSWELAYRTFRNLGRGRRGPPWCSIFSGRPGGRGGPGGGGPAGRCASRRRAGRAASGWHG
jgi:hypothetical protein